MSPLLPSNVSHCSLMNCTKFLSFLFIIFKHRRICNKNRWATKPVQWTSLKILVVPNIVYSWQVLDQQWPPWRYAEERQWPPAMRHGELHCSLHDSARGPGEKSPSRENKRALDGDEEDSEDSLLYRHRQRTNSAFLLKISLHTCSPRHSAAGLVLIDFHCGHDWAKIRFPGEITHKYSASPPTIS